MFNGNDDNAVGAMRAIKQANRFAPIGDAKHIVIISIDGTEQALTAIRAGQMDGTLSQNPLTMAAQSVAYVEAVPATARRPGFRRTSSGRTS